MGGTQISFCVALKDRSNVDLEEGITLNLFPNCIKSLVAACERAGVVAEVVVADFGSSDEPFAKEALEGAGLSYQWETLEGGFCRGRGLNRAALRAKAPVLFFLDADMLVSVEVVRRVVDLVEDGVAYFPWCLSYRDPAHTSAWERTEGWGMCGVTLRDFLRAGNVVEKGQWGLEDIYFREVLTANGIRIVREQGEGLFHQWHPNDQVWKNRFSEKLLQLSAAKERNEGCVFEMQAAHPVWSDRLKFSEDGRFSRSNGDSGDYVLVEGESLTLNWDDWENEALEWHSESGQYVSPKKNFSLEPIS